MLSAIRDPESAIRPRVVLGGFARNNAHSSCQSCFVQRFIRGAHHERRRLRLFFSCAAHRHELAGQRVIEFVQKTRGQSAKALTVENARHRFEDPNAHWSCEETHDI